jgi:hypothetical protein
MAVGQRTYRIVDEQRVEGTWRHIFTRDTRTYTLTDLIVYADGRIDCGTGGPTNLDGLRERLRSGRVVTAPPEGARAWAHHLASWQVAQPHAGIDADMLLGESELAATVADIPLPAAHGANLSGSPRTAGSTCDDGP